MRKNVYEASMLWSKERKGPVHWPRPELLPHAGEGRGSLQKRWGEKVGQTGRRGIMKNKEKTKESVQTERDWRACNSL